MADIETPMRNVPQAEPQARKQPKQDRSSAKPHKVPLHQIYALPVPLRTFPLPSFYPNNPLSLFHVLASGHPRRDPSIFGSPDQSGLSGSKAFFGKGSYSRSEPNWLKREQSRQGQGNKKVSELVTVQRREERKMMKWDRARKEQEAILRTRLEEAWVAPVGPKELLALPNSPQDLHVSLSSEISNGHAIFGSSVDPATPPTSASFSGNKVPSGSGPILPMPELDVNGNVTDGAEKLPFLSLNDGHPDPPTVSIANPVTSPDLVACTLKRRKSVRFSPNVESTTFQLGDPPSPHCSSLANGKLPNGDVGSESLSLPQPVEAIPMKALSIPTPVESPASPPQLVDREHLQLSLEETFYLVFALGTLSVTDPATGQPITAEELFPLACQLSVFPPDTSALRPDNPFLVQYAVYHHFRSLGWVPRAGIKFGVDWLLYIGGPVFSHAEFAVIVLPAYTDPYWKSQGHEPPKRSWHWLHSINRVQSHALKTMVLVYVDIPPPTQQVLDPSSLLKRIIIASFVFQLICIPELFLTGLWQEPRRDRKSEREKNHNDPDEITVEKLTPHANGEQARKQSRRERPQTARQCQGERIEHAQRLVRRRYIMRASWAPVKAILTPTPTDKKMGARIQNAVSPACVCCRRMTFMSGMTPMKNGREDEEKPHSLRESREPMNSEICSGEKLSPPRSTRVAQKTGVTAVNAKARSMAWL
ncbi:hypothetical protein NUW58_g9162 [Xylaria curta]|uniref:Uncharacterized protein n=1 Tax=Xylaria curta TaxID=42375 RepID=A0ACC1N0L7_9PEZI|nr:hypothetical protein NUW58_g9162 [Xylaria curta]